jgi:thiamine biosynthesis lipoprotein
MTNDEFRTSRHARFHSSFLTRFSPLITRPSPFLILHSSLVIRHSSLLLCLCVLVVNAAELYPHPAPQRFEYFRMQMGTKFRIVLYADTEEQARAAAAAAFEQIGRLDENMTDYNPESELMQLCSNGHERPVRVSSDLFFVLQESVRYSKLSRGAFDVTVGPLVALWRQARKSKKIPDPESLRKARALVGYKNLILNAEASTVYLRCRGMRLDLGGIAKGYAVDQALAVLKGRSIESALVDAGGNIGVSRPPPGQDRWRISIQNPADVAFGEEVTILLREGAVATSGDTEQFVEIGGRRYSHIVDPKTGLGVEHSAGVTVIAHDATATDALATALSVLPPGEGMKLAESLNGVAVRIVARQDNSYREYVSSRMKSFRLLGASR